MLGKCANPGCHSQFRSLRDGKLFHFEGPQPDMQVNGVEHFWLCEKCAREFTLVPGTGGVTVIAAQGAKASQ